MTALGHSVASVFNLINGWVCGGPGGFEDWPWLAQPVQPKWWVSNLSTVHNGTVFWTEDAGPWQLHFPGKGIYCLNRTKERGVRVWESVCEWALSPGFDCYDPYCRPYDCSKY